MLAVVSWPVRGDPLVRAARLVRRPLVSTRRSKISAAATIRPKATLGLLPAMPGCAMGPWRPLRSVTIASTTIATVSVRKTGAGCGGF
jgi:hypothetical protein